MRGLPERYKQKSLNINGGMGDVIFCDDTTLERTVAIKFIKNPTDERRMLDELAALMLVRSKHVVQVYDIIQTKHEGIGIVQEFIAGNDLIEGFSHPKTTIEYYSKIWQIAAGISEIHSAGIIHRDIKPNNMKLDPEGVIKIYDFGLARETEFNAKTVGFIGTHGFAAPELYTKNPTFTTAVDVYSFGTTALFLATGTLPNDIIHACGRPVAPHHFNLVPLSLDPEVQYILNHCLQHSPKMRPPMAYVRDTLAKYILANQHQALVVHRGTATYLNAKNKGITLELSGIGKIVIEYNGSGFIATTVSNEVYINNIPVSINAELPGSCVVALGGPQRRANEREFITFDISNPEIIL